MEAQIDSVLGGLDFSALSDIRLALPGQEGEMGVKEAARALAQGASLSPEDMLAGALRLFGQQAAKLGALMLSIMLPVLLASLVTHTLAADGGAVSALGRSVCFMLVLIPVMLCVLAELSHVRDTIT